jgi:hypothetical protein
MVYRKEPTIYTLKFEDPEFDGLIVRMKSLTTSEFLRLTSLKAETSKDPSGKTDAGIELIEKFAKRLVSWNLEEPDEDGEWKPVPATVRGVKSQEFGFITFLMGEWLQAIAGVPSGPLDSSSTSGGTSLEESIPMDQ